MKHSQLKGKTLQFNRSVKHGQKFFDTTISNYKERYAKTYYDIENKFEVTLEKVTDKKYIVKMDCEEFHFFQMPLQPVNFFIGHSKSHERSYDQKVNRDHYIFKDASLCFELNTPESESKEVSITFRAGGDYIVNKDKPQPSYGQKLKQSDFFENGFSIFAYDGSEIVYEEVTA